MLQAESELLVLRVLPQPLLRITGGITEIIITRAETTSDLAKHEG